MYIQTLLLLASSYSNRWCLLKRWNSPTTSWINMATWVQYLGLWIPWDEIEKSHKTSSKSLPPLALPLPASVPESFYKNIYVFFGESRPLLSRGHLQGCCVPFPCKRAGSSHHHGVPKTSATAFLPAPTKPRECALRRLLPSILGLNI